MAEWKALAGLLDRPDWAADARLETPDGRRRHTEAIDAAIAGWTGARRAEEAAEVLQRHDIAAGLVASCADLHADPQLRHTGLFVQVEHPVLGSAPLEGNGFRLPDSRRAGAGAPLWGEHTEAVFDEWLGLGRDEVARLREDRVLW